MNNMGHFINWKFGVPVRVSSRNSSPPYTDKVLLIQETENTFTVRFSNFIKEYNKAVYCYELIPYTTGHSSPRYMICENNEYTAFCNGSNIMTELDRSGGDFKLKPFSVATLNINGKTIELSAETTAELKKKLGV
ncbi:hypothetical protein LCGC14_2773670 [marine sediment metagenome]|uniref:Uncharacterized protein n=1 Tax=marine sediment metagenome TaxID=412755 RepID=A0A0F8YVD0_9ZZZZ